MSLPNPTITPIPNNEPDAVPALWNTRYAEIDENFTVLDARQASVEQALNDAKGDASSVSERMNQVAQAVQDLGGDVGNLQGMTAPMLARAVRLDWDYSGNNISLEMWAGDYTLMDIAPVPVLSAIAGDDSIDVEDASVFTPGQHYVIHDADHAEQVYVEAVLTGERIRVAAPLDHAYSGAGAFLARTSFAIANGTAHAKPGAAWFSKPVNLGFDATRRAVVIRRTPTASTVSVDFLIDGAWVNAPLAWTREGGKVPAGVIDCEYELTVSGDTSLRVTVTGGSSDAEIRHIIGLGAATGLRGEHTPPHKPVMSNPVDGAQDLTDRPTMTLTGYASPTGTPVSAVQFQVSEAADFSDITLDSGVQEGGLSWQEVGLRLQPASAYYARGRARDVEGAWSPWSDPVSFSTATSFVYVQAPQNVGPANNLTNVADTPMLSSSSFAVYAGTDSHQATQWQIREAGASYDAATLDTGEDFANLTAFSVPAGVLKSSNTEYLWRARHKGAAIGWSEWSVETRFTTKKNFGTVIGIALVSTGATSGSWTRIDEDGNAKTTNAAFFNAHPTYAGIVSQTIDGQAMMKIPAFYIKTGVVSAGAYTGKRAIWVSDKKETGFALHPAFKRAGADIKQYWVGKYQGSNATGNKLASVPGVAPLVSIDFPAMQSRANARNTGGVSGFALWNIYQLSAIQMLALIELGNPDVQTLVSQGHSNGSGATNVDAPPTSQASWRGIIGLWSNVWQMVDGLQTDGARRYKIWDNKGNKTWVTTNQVAPSASASWIVTMSDDAGANYDLSQVFVPATIDGSASNGTYADGFWSNANCVAYHGGSWYHGALDGLFCLYVGGAASYVSTSVGGRLAKV